jgi:hypothetical protein
MEDLEMAKVGEFNSTLAEAIRVLDRPERSGAPELRKAMALVHGSGAFRASDLETRFTNTHIGFNAETGKLALNEAAMRQPEASWVAMAGIAAAKHLGTDDVIVNNKLQVWQAVGVKHRSSSGAAGAVRSAEGARRKVDAMVVHPVVRRAMLATVEHTKRGRDPFESYEGVVDTLQTGSVQKHLNAANFRDDLHVSDSDRMYDVYGTEDGAFVQMTQLLGSYARKLSIQNNQQRERVATVQSVLITRQTVFGVDPEYSNELFGGYNLSQPGPHELGADTVSEIDTFVDASVDAVVPLSSSLYAAQDFRVMNREMYQ